MTTIKISQRRRARIVDVEKVRAIANEVERKIHKIVGVDVCEITHCTKYECELSEDDETTIRTFGISIQNRGKCVEIYLDGGMGRHCMVHIMTCRIINENAYRKEHFGSTTRRVELAFSDEKYPYLELKVLAYNRFDAYTGDFPTFHRPTRTIQILDMESNDPFSDDSEIEWELEEIDEVK